MRLPIADKTQLCVTGIPLPVQASGFSLSSNLNPLLSQRCGHGVRLCTCVCVQAREQLLARQCFVCCGGGEVDPECLRLALMSRAGAAA